MGAGKGEKDYQETLRASCSLKTGATGIWIKARMQLGMLAHAFHLSTREDLCEFETSLDYKASSKTARAITKRKLVLKYQNQNKQNIFASVSTLLVLRLKVCDSQTLGLKV